MRGLLLVCIFLASPVLQAQNSRDDRWSADLDFLVNTLQSRHPNLYSKVSRSEWSRAAGALRENIPQLSDTQIAMEMARITAFAGDGHTFLNLRTSPLFTSLPVRMQWFDEGWVVTAAPSTEPGLIGTVVTQIDNTPIAEVMDKLRPFVAYENEWWFRVQVLNYLISPEILSNLGIQSSRASLTINVESTILAAAPAITFGPILAQPRFPLWSRYSGVNYWFHYLADSRTLYFKYNVCTEMPIVPASQFRAELAAALAANPVERFIVDVRNNTGGNSELLDRLLPPLPEDAKRIVITGRQTFSSGMLNAERLSLRGWTLIGEPTGGKPTSFGEVLTFTLPNSGLRGQFSTKLFSALVQPSSDALMPDVLVPWRWAAASQEQDPFLEAALAWN